MNSNKASKAKKTKSNNFKLRNLKYYLEETIRGFARNKLMSLTSVATVAACLLIVVFSIAIAQNINSILSYIENTVGVMVFLDDELNDTQAEIIFNSISELDNVASAEYITPEEALTRMANNLGDVDGILLSLLYDNPLSRSISIELNDIRQQRTTVDSIHAMTGVRRINEASDITDMMITANSFIGIFSFLIILILGVLAVIIITNTIKLTVNNRRNEIIIMKYVGATDWFIKWPFVIEGVIIGVIGALIPLIVGWFSYESIVSSVSSALYPIEIPFLASPEIFPVFSPVIIILGAAIGLLGSISSIRKYLSV